MDRGPTAPVAAASAHGPAAPCGSDAAAVLHAVSRGGGVHCARPRRRSDRPDVAFHLLAIAVAASLVPCCAAAEELRFGLPDEPTAEGVEQVISGDLRIRGSLQIDKMPDLRLSVVSALSKVCENRSSPVVVDVTLDISTLNDARPEWVMKYYLLPPLGGGQYCLETMAMASYGKAEAPFDDIIGPPPFRQILQMEVKNNKQIYTLRLDKWKIDLANHTCEFQKVIAPTERQYTKWTTTRPPGPPMPSEACRDGDPLMPKWIPPDKHTDPVDIRSCNYAMNACMCHAFGNCTWVMNSVGGFGCQPAEPWEKVTCAQCPLLLDCPLSAEAICAQVLSPCACAASIGNCRWDMASTTCILYDGHDTPCASCTDQNFCTKPSVLGVEPAMDIRTPAVLGSEEVGWLVNITFDRPVRLDAAGLATGVRLDCRSVAEQAYTQFYIGPQQFRTFADGSTTVLQINLEGIENSRLRECEVVISDHLLKDRDYVFYAGMHRGESLMTMLDTKPPTLLSFYPENSRTGADINESVTIFFSEPVIPSNRSYLTLMQLGGEWKGGIRGAADVAIDKLDLTSPRITFSQSDPSLSIDFTGLIVNDVLYSIMYSTDAMRDRAGNVLQGLDYGFYNFRTRSMKVELPSGHTDDGTELYIVEGVAGGVGLVLLIVLAMVAYRLCKRRRESLRGSRKGKPTLSRTVPDVGLKEVGASSCEAMEVEIARERAARKERILSSTLRSWPPSPANNMGDRPNQMLAWTDTGGEDFGLEESVRTFDGTTQGVSPRSGASKPSSRKLPVLDRRLPIPARHLAELGVSQMVSAPLEGAIAPPPVESSAVMPYQTSPTRSYQRSQSQMGLASPTGGGSPTASSPISRRGGGNSMSPARAVSFSTQGSLRASGRGTHSPSRLGSGALW